MTIEKPALDATPHPAKLTARDFWLLADSSAFAANARTELIEGEIWAVNSVHRWHARTLGAMHITLTRAIEAAGLTLEVLIAGSVSMSEVSVPEPDLSVIAPVDEEAKTIAVEELKLAVEISDTTADFDLGRKAALYARHGIPEYWVVHRDGGVLVQMWAPQGEAYTERREVRLGNPAHSATLPGLIVQTRPA